MGDLGVANGGSPPHVSGLSRRLSRIRTNSPAGAESNGSGMDELPNGHLTPHELPRTDRAASAENGYRPVDDPVDANGDGPSREPPSTAGPARTGVGYREEHAEEANDDGPTRLSPYFRSVPREYPRVSFTFTSDPEDSEGNESRLRHDLISYVFATDHLLSSTGLATLHSRRSERRIPVLAARYEIEPEVELTLGFSVSDQAPRWERVDQGLLLFTRREVHENLRVMVGHANEDRFDDIAHYDIYVDPMTRPADRDA